MLKSIFKKVMSLGRVSVFTVGLSLTLALTFGVTSSAGAHTGYAGLLHLGHWNPVTAISGLYGSVANTMLYLSNTSTDSKATALTAVNKSVAAATLTAVNNGGGPALRLSVASGKAPMVVSAGAAKVANLDADKLDGKDSTDFATGTSGKANDADKVDGLDSTALGLRTEHNFSYSSDCDTPNTWNQCGKVQVVVPTGKQYLVSVWSTMSWRGGTSDQTIYYCSAQNNSCITPFGPYNTVTLPAGKTISASSEGETLTLSEGTYTFNTLLYPGAEVANDYNTQVLTKVMVRDASVPQPTGVSIP